MGDGLLILMFYAPNLWFYVQLIEGNKTSTDELPQIFVVASTPLREVNINSRVSSYSKG